MPAARRAERTRCRVAVWLERGEPHPVYARAWACILELPFDELAAALVTPFAGALTPRERWTIWREVGRRHGVE